MITDEENMGCTFGIYTEECRERYGQTQKQPDRVREYRSEEDTVFRWARAKGTLKATHRWAK